MSDSCYPVVLASSLTSLSLFRFAHNVSGDLKIGIRNGDENPDGASFGELEMKLVAV